MRAFCITIAFKTDSFLEIEEKEREIKELAKTAGYQVIESQVIYTSFPSAAFLLGRGIIENLKEELEIKNIEIVIINKELTPTQARNLEKIWQKMVIDRTELILRIFQLHAKTKEAKIQVEIAQLRYTLPRLKRLWTHLSRIEGGFGFTKGPGEKQIEIDRRLIKNRIAFLSTKLKEIDTRRETRRKKRISSSLPLVSLVGYANAGKTTLLNYLAKENLTALPQMFSTISPVTRKIFLQDHYFALVSDTVGFIRDLPEFLLASFHSTIQEINFSDIIFILQDISEENFENKLHIIYSLLHSLQIEKPVSYIVWTKCDLVSREKIQKVKTRYPDSFFISALTGEGIPQIKNKILEYAKRKNLSLLP